MATQDGKHVGKEDVLISVYGSASVPSLWEAGWCYIKNLNTQLPYDLATPILCIYGKVGVILFCIYAIATLFTAAKKKNTISLDAHQEVNG